ncbi:hypothetical protein ACRAVF_25870 [Bradyrhizobium oligotrophicum S58]
MAGAAPGRTVGLASGPPGGGTLPCWISVARCATAGGRAGATATAGVVTAAGPAVIGPAGGAGRLITVLMTAVLWMFW